MLLSEEAQVAVVDVGPAQVQHPQTPEVTAHENSTHNAVRQHRLGKKLISILGEFLINFRLKVEFLNAS